MNPLVRYLILRYLEYRNQFGVECEQIVILAQTEIMQILNVRKLSLRQLTNLITTLKNEGMVSHLNKQTGAIQIRIHALRLNPNSIKRAKQL